ncbi:MAG: response regulator [Oscillospiraceae bacterium]|nr:response regulator [Oscillospiraceae bacterium]
MNVIAVDDEQYALHLLKSAILEVIPGCTVFGFDSSADALEYAEENRVDIAFLDIRIGDTDGLFLAKYLRGIYSMTNIIFVTGFTHYAVASYEACASDYLLKPVTHEAIACAVTRLRNPIAPPTVRRVRVQTFGNFEIFTDGKPLLFTYAKTRELFAYLVHRRGAVCSNNEIMAALWEDRADTPSLKSYFRSLVSDLMLTLTSKGLRDMVLKKHGHIAVITERFRCDYYDFIEKHPRAIRAYAGEYMTQFSWAEETNAYLQSVKENEA